MPPIPQIPSLETLSQVLPEIWLITAMCAVILVPFIKRDSVTLPAVAAVLGLGLALVSTLMTLGGSGPAGAILGGMLAIDPFSQFFKIILLVFTLLVVVQWLIATRHHTAPGDTPDFLCLLLGATLGMSLLASANNLLMIFIAMEATSFPSYALAGFRKRSRLGTEGSLKYVVFGSAASAIMVYGMSLIYGLCGTLDLGGVAQQAALMADTAAVPPMLAAGLLAMFVGIAFKLSAVPLHFWCPDVFQGAPTEVTTFLSVASKGAAMALLLRVLITFGVATPVGTDVFAGLGIGVMILGAITATWGNLVALHQTNIKRLLAYSSIAHAGYMVMASGLIVTAAGTAGAATLIASAVLFYLIVYVFMNLGAFTVAAVIARDAGTEDIREYAGMLRRSPMLTILLGVFLLSLFGMPSLGGFMGKIYLMQVMADAGAAGFALIAVLLINTLLSLYFYVRPLYYMVFVPDTQDRPAVVLQPAVALLLLVCASALFWTGLLPETANRLAHDFSYIRTPAAVTATVEAVEATEITAHAHPAVADAGATKDHP